MSHDWGALLAWNFSIYYPSLVERMVVVSAAPMSVYQGVSGGPVTGCACVKGCIFVSVFLHLPVNIPGAGALAVNVDPFPSGTASLQLLTIRLGVTHIF